jgi:hypothetical protein
MSYSFNFRAVSKDDARQQARQAFDGVVDMQLVHAQDRAAALSALDEYLELLANDGRDVMVSVNGSVSYQWEAGADEKAVPLSSASLSISAYLVAKEVAAEPVAEPVDPDPVE